MTHGLPVVVGWHGDESLQSVVARIESHSTHPIAISLVKAFRDMAYPAEFPSPTQIEEPGDGGNACFARQAKNRDRFTTFFNIAWYRNRRQFHQGGVATIDS